MADLSEIKQHEGAEIAELRRRKGMDTSAETVGLAFSGGGIRSATFNLGVLQGLATNKLLRRFDYISTVSGGGYIGSWLISWIKRSGLDPVENALASAPPRFAQALPYKEPGPINFLRDYSNYLTPQLGLLSADTWSAAAMIVRNMLLNLTIIVCFLAAVLLLPHFAPLALQCLQGSNYVAWMHWLALLLMVVGLSFVTLNLADFSWRGCEAAAWEKRKLGGPDDPQDSPATSLGDSSFTDQKWVLLFAAIPIFLAAVLGSYGLWDAVRQGVPGNLGCWLWGGFFGYTILRLLGIVGGWGLLVLRVRDNACVWKREIAAARIVLITAPLAGAFGGFLLRKLATVFCQWTSACPKFEGLSLVASFGPPLLVLIILLTGVLHIGLMGLLFTNQRQEWWARLGGWLLIGSTAWALFFAMSIFAPLGVIKLTGLVKTKAAIIATWVVSTLSGLLAGKSAKTSGEKGASSSLEVVALIAPYVFVIGLLAAISYGIYYFVPPGAPSVAATNQKVEIHPGGKMEVTVPESGGSPSVTGDIKLTVSSVSDNGVGSEAYWNRWEGKDKYPDTKECPTGCKPAASLSDSSPSLLARLIDPLLGLCARWRSSGPPLQVPALLTCWLTGLSIVVLILAWRVDINEFSMHLLYRNRLVRCYLGASNGGRDPQRFTGFDPADDIPLTEFSSHCDKTYAGPYPIINAALDVTHGEKLAWQERKAESFVFTPGFCGYDFQEEHQTMPGLLRTSPLSGGYCPTPSYAYKGGVFLGTAFAISGAAASPNMGYHTSSALAFLMTIFNVRLGWWLGNPRRRTQDSSSPYLSILYLLFELFANTTDRSRFIYLSDGGHFENLGLYELVRRGCRYIVVSDADADGEMKFEDLGNAIRKCRSDFGVEITLRVDSIKPLAADKTSTSHCVLGTIAYPNGNRGQVLYIKTSITGEEPEDVLAYRAAHPEFPHQTTADQWFDESQFESYRALGRFVIESLLDGVGTPDEVSAQSTKALFENLSEIMRTS
jgi:Patatin-like phospholipase